MAYSTKESLISQALLYVGGGVVNSDLTTRWGECETYLAAAVNYIQTGNYWFETKAEGERTINPLMLTPFENLTVAYSTTRKRYYVNLPKNVVTLPKGRALEVNTVCGKKCYPLSQSDEALEEFYGPLKGVISYQIEGPRKIWLYGNIGVIIAVNAKYLVHVNDLDDTDEIILPSDAEVKVIEMMVQFLKGELSLNKDYIEDGKPN